MGEVYLQTTAHQILEKNTTTRNAKKLIRYTSEARHRDNRDGTNAHEEIGLYKYLYISDTEIKSLKEHNRCR